jgi:uncharacterized protein
MTSATPSRTRAVFDSSPLVFLDALGYSELIKRLHETFIPPEVATELSLYPERFGASVPSLPWLITRSPSATTLQTVKRSLTAGAGEQSAIALALDLGALVVSDDARARRYALAAGLKLTGTLGILSRIHRLGWATQSIEKDLDGLEQNNMRLTIDLRELILASVKGARP